MRNPLTAALFVCVSTLAAQAPFQQRCDHRIEVTLDDKAHLLRGQQTFTYHNNAPRALDTLWIHLWANAYASDHHSALCQQKDQHNDFDLHFAKEELRGGIDSLNFTTDGLTHMWGFHPKHRDIAWIALVQPVASGASIAISTPFRVRIPDAQFSRMGRSGQAYYISQWYPKPALFDQDGWHALPYLDHGEFYNSFGHYDVSITLPANYVMGATGVLTDAPEEEAWLDSLAALPPHFLLNPGAAQPAPPSASSTKTLRYVQDQVTDFAWFADKRFSVKKGSVTLPVSGRSVTTWALYTPQNAAVWQDAISYIDRAVLFYSEQVGEYPYASCTAVDGTISAGGGMEYPMITIIGNMYDTFDLDVVIAHEVGHNWFQGMLATNERIHPWMDEGINSYFEQRYVEHHYPGALFNDVQGLPVRMFNRGKGVTYRERNELQYLFNTRRNHDAPLGSASTDFSMLDYGFSLYAKGALVFDHLHSALGAELFDRCIKAYFASWQYRHPGPQDMRAVFEATSGQDLGWFFEGLVLRNEKLDPHVGCRHGKRAKVGSNAIAPTPVPVRTSARPDSVVSVSRTASVCLELPDAEANLRVDPAARTLDIKRRNNEQGQDFTPTWRRFPAVRFATGLEQEERPSMFWFPLVGINAHDGWMPGALVHNMSVPSKRLEWAFAPMYGTKSGRLSGGGRIEWNHDRIRSSVLRNIRIGVSGWTASTKSSIPDEEAYYARVVPSITFVGKSNIEKVRTELRFRSILLDTRDHWFTPIADATSVMTGIARMDQRDVYHEARIETVRDHGLHPFNANATLLHHEHFTRASVEAQWSAIYDRKKHRVTLRAFAGTFLRRTDNMTALQGWRLHWGSTDLLHDELYFHREGVWTNNAIQFNKTQGGFKSPTRNGTSNSWIAALNLEADLPIPLPLVVFAGYGAAPMNVQNSDGSRSERYGDHWECGLGLRVWRDRLEVWMPLAQSSSIKSEMEFHNMSVGKQIRIVVALQRMDATRMVRGLMM